MIQRSSPLLKRSFLVLVFALCAASWTVSGTVVQARERLANPSTADHADPVQDGALLFHGNYCGPGNRPGTRPVDALDAACMRHDFCGSPEGLKSCACNMKFQREAEAIA